MRAHRSGDAPSRRPARRYIAAIRDMPPAASLVRLQKIGPDNSLAVVSNKYFVTFGEPIIEGLPLAEILRQRVAVAGANDRLENLPNLVEIRRSGRPDIHAKRIAREGPAKVLLFTLSRC